MSKRINVQENIVNVKNELSFLKSIFVQKKKWYNSPSIIISILALLLSIGSAVISYKQFQEQNFRNLKSELRENLQRIINLNRENTDIMDNNPKRFHFYSSILTEENILLLNRSMEIVNDLPKEEICAIEYFTLSKALFNAYRLDEALKYAYKAIGIPNDTHTDVAGHRWCAQLLFSLERFASGRNEYKMAIETSSKSETLPSYIKNLSNLETEYNWAISEANISLLDNAQKHIEKAKSYIHLIPISMRDNICIRSLAETEYKITDALSKKLDYDLKHNFDELEQLLGIKTAKKKKNKSK